MEGFVRSVSYYESSDVILALSANMVFAALINGFSYVLHHSENVMG